MMRGEKTILVLTEMTITAPDGTNRDATLRYVFHLDTREADTQDVDVPGVPGAKMRVVSVSPNDGAVVLRLTGLSKDPAAEFQPATRESLSLDVTRKPFISVVWGGFYVLMAGALLALVKRTREARKAVLSEGRSPSPAREIHTAPVAAPATSRTAPAGP